jgi:hypothetical protein
MTHELYKRAEEGDVEELCRMAEETAEADEDGRETNVFRWLQVAAMLGSDEAEEMADDLYEAALSRGGDETVAVLHLEVAQWFIRGEHGVAQSAEHGLTQLELAEELQLRESVDVDEDLRSLRSFLKGEDLNQFDELYPGLGN